MRGTFLAVDADVVALAQARQRGAIGVGAVLVVPVAADGLAYLGEPGMVPRAVCADAHQVYPVARRDRRRPATDRQPHDLRGEGAAEDAGEVALGDRGEVTPAQERIAEGRRVGAGAQLVAPLVGQLGRRGTVTIGAGEHLRQGDAVIDAVVLGVRIEVGL